MNTTAQLEAVHTPTSTAPPAPRDVQPRIEGFDWIFVGWRSVGPRIDNSPPRDIRVTDEAELNGVIDVYVTRDAANERYPYLFITPALASLFEDRAVAALFARAQVAGVQADVSQIRKEVHASLLPAEKMPGWGIILLGAPSQIHSAPSGRRLVEADQYERVKTELDEIKAPPIPILPEREREIVRQAHDTLERAWRDTQAEGEEWSWPGPFLLSQWIAKRYGQGPSATDTSNEREEAPDPKLAARVESIIVKFYDDKGHGPRRLDIENRVSARHDRLTDALAWLTRPSGSIIKRRRNRADEYLPADEA
ncbi:MAG TPA: hypothetical protein VIV83_07550 [Gemmatimonadales bacterium]